MFRPWIVGKAHDPKIVGTTGTFNTSASPLGFRELATFYTSTSATKLTDLADPYVKEIDKAETLEEVNRITQEAYKVIYDNYIGLPLFHGAQVYGVASNIDFQPDRGLFPTSNDSIVGLGSAYAIRK